MLRQKRATVQYPDRTTRRGYLCFSPSRDLPLPAAEDVQGRQNASLPGTSFFNVSYT